MHLVSPDGSIQHLSYCSNIHPAESWNEVNANLKKHLLPIKAQLVENKPFGIGLRLSSLAAEELAQPAAMQAFKAFLKTNNCYVFTINGFPYGPFHGTRVKEDVYLPDWKDNERLQYTNNLADLFAQFLPNDISGTISTVPGAFKARVESDADIHRMAEQMVNHVAHLIRLEQQTGSTIKLALEPEPCCFLETIDEAIVFFKDHLYSDYSIDYLSSLLNIDREDAEQLLKKHLTLCFDLCHAAVEFEDAKTCIDKLGDADINIGKIQISAGLRITDVDDTTIELLKPFDDNVYLHQVVEKDNGRLKRYKDLPEAFSTLQSSHTANSDSREWRVHFHVPIFLNSLGKYSSTQFFITEFLALHRNSPVTDHLEVETYTWNVLPEHCKTDDIDDAIIRELKWARDQLMLETTEEVPQIETV